MITNRLQFHHFGLAVTKPEKATAFLELLGYTCVGTANDELQAVKVAMFAHDTMPDVEVICKSGTPGPLDNILQDKDELIYHLCYRVDDIPGVVEDIKKAGFRVLSLSEPKPAVLFHDKKVGFYYINGFGIVEFLEA